MSSSTPESAPAIAARDLTKTFESGDGVTGLDIEIAPGTIFGFIGPSGSGKTTTVRLLTGTLKPSGGSLSVLGRAPSEFDGDHRARIGYMPQLSVLYPHLSVDANLRFFAALQGMTGTGRRREEVLDFVGLAEHRSKRVDRLSGGMQRRLSLAAAFVHDPEVVFLDEPTAGIDPLLRRRFWDRFQELRDDGRTLFVTTQYVGEAAYCDLVGVLAEGRLLTVETPDGLRRDAFGGDIVEVRFERPPAPGVVEAIADDVSASAWAMSGMRGARLTVPEAATVLPRIAALAESHGERVEQVEERYPPFDDVFVEIVERHRVEQP